MNKIKLNNLGIRTFQKETHTGTTGVLGPGFWGTRRLAMLAVGYSKPPAPERPVVPVCKVNRIAPELFLVLKKCGANLLWVVEEED